MLVACLVRLTEITIRVDLTRIIAIGDHSFLCMRKKRAAARDENTDYKDSNGTELTMGCEKEGKIWQRYAQSSMHISELEI